MLHVIGLISALATFVLIVWGPAIFGALAVYTAIAFPSLKKYLDAKKS